MRPIVYGDCGENTKNWVVQTNLTIANIVITDYVMELIGWGRTIVLSWRITSICPSRTSWINQCSFMIWLKTWHMIAKKEMRMKQNDLRMLKYIYRVQQISLKHKVKQIALSIPELLFASEWRAFCFASQSNKVTVTQFSKQLCQWCHLGLTGDQFHLMEIWISVGLLLQKHYVKLYLQLFFSK